MLRNIFCQHNAAGRRTRLTFPDGAFFTYERDAAGNLTAVRENGGTVVASFSYDGRGLVSGRSAGAVASGFGYDDVSRLTGF